MQFDNFTVYAIKEAISWITNKISACNHKSKSDLFIPLLLDLMQYKQYDRHLGPALPKQLVVSKYLIWQLLRYKSIYPMITSVCVGKILQLQCNLSVLSIKVNY